jgi:complement component 1 Q subcomponent-binding protein
LGILADASLCQRLAQELQYEAEANKNDTEPEFLQTFKAEGIWHVSSIWFLVETPLTIPALR